MLAEGSAAKAREESKKANVQLWLKTAACQWGTEAAPGGRLLALPIIHPFVRRTGSELLALATTTLQQGLGQGCGQGRRKPCPGHSYRPGGREARREDGGGSSPRVMRSSRARKTGSEGLGLKARGHASLRGQTRLMSRILRVGGPVLWSDPKGPAWGPRRHLRVDSSFLRTPGPRQESGEDRPHCCSAVIPGASSGLLEGPPRGPRALPGGSEKP